MLLARTTVFAFLGVTTGLTMFHTTLTIPTAITAMLKTTGQRTATRCQRPVEDCFPSAQRRRSRRRLPPSVCLCRAGVSCWPGPAYTRCPVSRKVSGGIGLLARSAPMTTARREKDPAAVAPPARPFTATRSSTIWQYIWVPANNRDCQLRPSACPPTTSHHRERLSGPAQNRGAGRGTRRAALGLDHKGRQGAQCPARTGTVRIGATA